nr:ral guanine nucleotide dissociation stimulator-like [Equus asinus]
MEQGVIPSLEMIFSYLELLHDETDYYVEGNVLSCQNEEIKFIKDIKLVQKAANLYTVQPDENFWAWFQAVEPLTTACPVSWSPDTSGPERLDSSSKTRRGAHLPTQG